MSEIIRITTRPNIATHPAPEQRRSWRDRVSKLGEGVVGATQRLEYMLFTLSSERERIAAEAGVAATDPEITPPDPMGSLADFERFHTAMLLDIDRLPEEPQRRAS